MTNCVTYFNSSLVEANLDVFDALSRPTTRTTGVTGVSPVDSTYSYNNRSEVVSAAIDNMKPQVEVKTRRVGGTTYPVPVPIAANRQLSLALRWTTQFAGARHGMGMPAAVAAEIIDAFQGQGNVIKKRDDVHKMAQANKAFAHYAW